MDGADRHAAGEQKAADIRRSSSAEQASLGSSNWDELDEQASSDINWDGMNLHERYSIETNWPSEHQGIN